MTNLIYTLTHRFYKSWEENKRRECYVLNSNQPQTTVWNEPKSVQIIDIIIIIIIIIII
jgi:hypothetical protein